MKARKLAILFLFVGIINFLIFAWDIENDRDFYTWVWLLSSIIGFLGSLRYFIHYDRD